jgi:multiple antibiotic resistance protein
MTFASPTGLRSRTVREQEEISYERDVSVFPLAIPLLAGPGAITTVLLFTGGRDSIGIVVFVGVLLAVMMLTLISLLLAPLIMRRVGETGSEVLTRVLGVLLAALAVQFVLDGIGASFG